METCTDCGGSLDEEDDRCPSCGAARVRPASERGPSTSAEMAALADEEPSSVPAGTWASTGDLDGPVAPEGPESRRMRTLPREPDAGALTSSPGIERPGREPSERIERGEASRAVRRSRPDAVTPFASHGRGRGLAVATAPEAEEEPPRPEGARVVAFPTTNQARAAGAATSSSPASSPSAATGPATATASTTGTPAVQSASASTSGLRAPQPSAPPAPPRWLASELLRERPPAEPLLWTSRILAAAGGAGVIAAVVVFGASGGMHLGLAGLAAAMAMAALVPVRFALRSGAFAVLGSTGLVLATIARSETGSISGLAAMGGTLLAAAQLLRAHHRTSKFARAAMVVGITVCAAWLALDGGLGAMVVQEERVEAWLGPGIRALLLVVLSLSLLAFIDDSSDSGCRVWPWLVLGWLGAEGAVAAVAGPLAGAASGAATPLFAAVAAVGWMQLWATTPGLGMGREPRLRGDG